MSRKPFFTKVTLVTLTFDQVKPKSTGSTNQHVKYGSSMINNFQDKDGETD